MRVYHLIFPIIIISLTIVSLGLINITYGQINETSQTYENTSEGFRFQYPDTYEGVTFLSPDTYENFSEGIRFQYPFYWGNLTNERGCINHACSIKPHVYSEMTYRFLFVIIRVFDKSSGLSPTCGCDTLMEFVRWEYRKIQNAYPDFTIINDNQTTVGKNYSAWQVEFLGTPRDTPMGYHENTTKLAVFTKANSKFYSILFYPITEQSKVLQLPELKQVIQSMEFLPTQIPVTKTPSFTNMNETEESKSDTTTENNPSGLKSR